MHFKSEGLRTMNSHYSFECIQNIDAV